MFLLNNFNIEIAGRATSSANFTTTSELNAISSFNARWNFDVANTEVLLRHFEEVEAECKAIIEQAHMDPKTGKRIVMAHPAYDQAIKASHMFNLLDARGVISVTERQAYIGRVRALAKGCAEAWMKSPAGAGA